MHVGERVSALFCGFLTLTLLTAAVLVFTGGRHAYGDKAPATVAGLFGTGAGHLQANDFAAAVEVFSEIIQISDLPPREMATAFYHRGIGYQKLDQDVHAIADYSNALWLQGLPQDIQARALYNRGVSYTRLRRTDEAMDDFNAALRLKPDYAKAYNNRGNLLRIAGHYARAIRNFETALALGYTRAYLAYHGIGLSFEEQGQSSEARQYFEKALRVNPDYEPARRRYAQLGGDLEHLLSNAVLDQPPESYVTVRRKDPDITGTPPMPVQSTSIDGLGLRRLDEATYDNPYMTYETPVMVQASVFEAPVFEAQAPQVPQVPMAPQAQMAAAEAPEDRLRSRSFLERVIAAIDIFGFRDAPEAEEKPVTRQQAEAPDAAFPGPAPAHTAPVTVIGSERREIMPEILWQKAAEDITAPVVAESEEHAPMQLSPIIIPAERVDASPIASPTASVAEDYQVVSARRQVAPAIIVPPAVAAADDGPVIRVVVLYNDLSEDSFLNPATTMTLILPSSLAEENEAGVPH